MKLSSSNIKKFLTFSQKKAFLIFRETETPQKIPLYFRKRSFLMFQEAETLKNFLYFRKLKSLKSFLYFRKWNFLVPKSLGETGCLKLDQTG